MKKNNKYKYSLFLANLALIQTSAVLAHGGVQDSVDITSINDVITGEAGHQNIDIAPSLAEEAELLLRVEAEKIGFNPNKINQFQNRIRTTLGSESSIGRWEPLQDWPVISVFTSVLYDGRVLSFDSVGDAPTESYGNHTFTRASIWDPSVNTHTRIDSNTGYNLFCSGFSSLPDGRLFIAGGNADSALNGIIETHTFNPLINEWSRAQRMDYARWYPAVTPLPNGEMLISGGGFATSEVRETDGSIRKLSGAAQDYWNNRDYPWFQTAPNGKVAFLGPDAQLGYVDSAGVGAWESTQLRDSVSRRYGSYAMYDIGKVLIAGGGFEQAGFTQKSAVVVDLNENTSSATSSMNNRRRQHNLTVLADGSVLATGGLSSNQGLVDLNNAVFEAELWNPDTQQWTRLADEDRARQYHSTAVLLPDARVLSAGGGICGTCQQVGYIQKNAQIFTPPYLFKQDSSGELAERPVISSVPAMIAYNTEFQVQSNQASQISKMALSRIGSVTHSQNMEQRYIPLNFFSQGNALVATSPLNTHIAPPGHYMLFIVDSSGVPSVAKIIQISEDKLVGQAQTEWENYAQGQSATQSSNYGDRYPASYAVDGSTDGNLDSGSVAHTNHAAQSWWEVDLGEVREIEQVSIFNRTDCCSNRLADFHLLVSDVPFTSNKLAEALGQQGVSEFYHKGEAGEETRIEVKKSGRYVRVQLVGSNFLQLAEVQVWGKASVSNADSNIAPLAAVTASSQNNRTQQTAEKAIDGIVDGWPGDYKREWASSAGKAGQSLTLTWTTAMSISEVVLFDRPNTSDRITAATLVFDDGSTVAVGALNNTAQAKSIVLPSAKTTRSLTVRIDAVSATTRNVGLAEIQVFGVAVTDPVPTPTLSNIASDAVATASSVTANHQQTADKAIDGVVDGWPGDYKREWAISDGKLGHTLTLTWGQAVTISEVILHDRPNWFDQITGGTLTFDDGSSIVVPSLDNGGAQTVVQLPSHKRTRTLTFTITSVSWWTRNAGLSEIKVIGF